MDIEANSDRTVRRKCGTPRMDLVKLEARELAPEAAERLSAHVHGCSDCSAVVAELGEARQTLFRLAEPVAASARILAAAESPSPRPRLALGLGLAASCLLALVVVTTSSPDPYSATKGGRSLDPRPPSSERASLELFTKTQAGISKADDGVELVEGDAIQLRYHSGPHRYLLVISIDGSHKVTPLYPPALDGVSLPIARGMGTLDGSIVLDEALGTEQVIGFFTDQPLRVADVVPAIERRLTENASTAALPPVSGEIVTRSFKKVPK